MMNSNRLSFMPLISFIFSYWQLNSCHFRQPNSIMIMKNTSRREQKMALGYFHCAGTKANSVLSISWAQMISVGQQKAMLNSVITRRRGLTPVVITRIFRLTMMMITASKIDPLSFSPPIVPTLSNTSVSRMLTITSRETTPKSMAEPTLRRKRDWLKCALVMPGEQREGVSVDSLKECSSSKTAHRMMGQLEQITLNSSYRKTLKIITPEKQVKPPKATVDATWNQFLKKLQLASSAFLRYHSRPQQRVRSRMNLNSPATKSATLAASVPSLPRMPMPTSAAVIMYTSFAPSPTASVNAEDLSLKILTISFLLAGVQRQQMVWSTGRILGMTFSALSRNTFFSLISLSFLICSCHPCSSPSMQAGMSTSRASWSISPQERPIFTAVSRLSPVRMKKVMPARRISVMVCTTSSCSSSQMAVAPTSSKFFSILSQHLSTASSFFSPMILLAFTYSSFHFLYSSSVRCFLPSMSVLSPFTLRLSMCCWVAVISFLSVSGRISSFTVESAPLVQSMISLDCASRTITDMRLRTELNSRKASFSYFMMVLREPLPSATSIMRLCSPSSSFSCSLAKLMSAISSGELELQVSLPPSSSTQMSWHRQISFSASCTFLLPFMPRSLASYILTLPRISAGVFLAYASSSSSPQSVPLQTKQRKSMLFLVRVPVLSVKTYLI